MSTHLRLAFFLCIIAALGSLAKVALGAITIGTSPGLVITSGDMSATITSSAVSIFGIDNINIQCVWTGTPTGTFVVKYSLDTANWNTGPVSVGATGAAGSFDVDINQLGSPYFQIVYTRTGGTGTVNCKAFGKKI